MELRKTPFFAKHSDLGAKMVPFEGWMMPLQYTGIADEHNAVRTSAGLFDVSHMGNLIIQGAEANGFLKKMLTNNIDLAVPGKGIYSHILREDGTIIDDTIVYNLGDDCFLMVPNASTKDTVLSWLNRNIDDRVEMIDISSRAACLAIQGPKAAGIAQRITKDNIMDIKRFNIACASVDGMGSGFLSDVMSRRWKDAACVFARTEIGRAHV